MPGKRLPFKCGICQKEAVWDKYKQRRHILTHTGASHPLAEGTRSVSRCERERENQRSMERLLESAHDKVEFIKLVKDIQHLKHSGPPEFRFKGGRFETGPLQDKGHKEGMPAFFSEHGRLKQRFEWILTYPVDRRTSNRLMARPRHNHAARPATSLAAQSFPNRKWAATNQQGIPFTPLQTNMWTPGKYPDWICPDGSDGNSEDPSLVRKDERQCDLCHGSQICDCIKTRVPQDLVPLVVPAGDMGEGTVARRRYNVGDILREIIGELVPLDTHQDGWAADLCRDDEFGKPVRWCSIYPLHYGNWARKVNHSCAFNVVFESMRVSQRWRVMLRAVKPIESGAWVTVNYGHGYWEDSGMACLCGSDNCWAGKGDGEEGEGRRIMKT